MANHEGDGPFSDPEKFLTYLKPVLQEAVRARSA